MIPLTMPEGWVGRQLFEIEEVAQVSPVLGGAVGAVTVGFPRWRARWLMGEGVSRAKAEEVRAFRTSLRGAQRFFYGYDVNRIYPLSCPNGFAGLTRAGGGAFDGTATSWSLNSDRDDLQLNNLPAAITLTFGDYVGFEWLDAVDSEPRRSLHRYVEAGTANGSGNIALMVEPPVPTLVPSGATATLARPTCLMRQIPSDSETGEMDRRGKAPVKISAIQVLLP